METTTDAELRLTLINGVKNALKELTGYDSQGSTTEQVAVSYLYNALPADEQEKLKTEILSDSMVDPEQREESSNRLDDWS